LIQNLRRPLVVVVVVVGAGAMWQARKPDTAKWDWFLGGSWPVYFRVGRKGVSFLPSCTGLNHPSFKDESS
jgi:hypothetical protein